VGGLAAALVGGASLSACGASPGAAVAPRSRPEASIVHSRSPKVQRLSGDRDAALARSQARKLRRWVGRPAGCEIASSVPTGTSSSLSSPDSEPLSPYVADSHEYCVITMSPDSVIHWYEVHVPKGASVGGTGTSSSRSGVTEQSVSLDWSPRHALPERGAEISVASLPGGRSVLRIDGLVLYDPAKPASEQVPTAVSRLVISVTPESGATVERTVKSPTAIARVVKIVNDSQRSSYTENPGGVMITAPMGREDVIVRCYGGADGTVLLASVNEHPLLGEGTGNMLVWVGGKRQPILQDDGALARVASQLTGVRIQP
jgi:hypothetical protein